MNNKQEEIEHIEFTDYWADVKNDTNVNKEEDKLNKNTSEKNNNQKNTNFNQDEKKDNIKEGNIKG
jgi:hypothetical protein